MLDKAFPLPAPQEQGLGEDAEMAGTGRAKGAKNYSNGELKLLVACFREIKPICAQDYARVENLYNRIAKEKGWVSRSDRPLRQRFEKVRCVPTLLWHCI